MPGEATGDETAAQRRRGDVLGQGPRQGHRRGLRGRAARRGARPAGAARASCSGRSARSSWCCTTSRPSTSTTQRITGFEALVRWDHPTPRAAAARGVHRGRRADRADRAAGQLGAARGLPRRRRHADRLAPARRWRSTSPPSSSPTPDFVDEVVRRAPADRGCRAERLVLEITESALLDDMDGTRRGAGPAPGPRHPGGHRRLRHRLQLAVLPVPAARRRAQGRQVLRRPVGGGADDTSLVEAIIAMSHSMRPHHRRRGRRAGRAGPWLQRARLRAGPGLPVVPSGRAAPGPGAAARRPAPRARPTGAARAGARPGVTSGV